MAEEKKAFGYSLAIIGRNCAEKLKALRDNFWKFPDEVVFVNTGISKDEEGFKETNEVAREGGAHIFHFPWIEDFAAARNFSFSKCSQPFILWLDTDDTVETPARCDQNIRMAINNGVDCITMEYVYERDSHGTITAVQRRERVVRKDAFYWSENAPIHEVLVARGAFNPVNMPGQGGRVLHDRLNTDHKRGRECLRRNKRVLEHNFGPGKKAPDKRMIFYWGNTLLGLGDHTGAIEKYKEYMARSQAEGNDHSAEKMQCMTSMATAYSLLDRLDEATKSASEALLLSPHSPTPYVELAKIAMRRSDFPNAAMHARLCLDRTADTQHELVSNPREVIGRAHLILAHCACSAGAYREALTEAEAAKPFFPIDPQFLQLYQEIQHVLARGELLASMKRVQTQLIAEKRVDDAAELCHLAPGVIADSADIQGLSAKPRPVGKRTIAIVCHPPEGHVPWGPWSTKEGIGGSEEAVINASAELAKLGWHVEVYAPTGKPCRAGPIVDAHGVHWYRIETWSGRMDKGLDIAISWRAPTLFRITGVNAKVKACWLHDIFSPASWAVGSEEQYDTFLLLSDYHRSLFSVIPEEKVFRTENALDPDLFVPLEDLKNEPHHMIWGSDPSRGLQYLLPWWKTIREAVPDATLDVFYGWSQHFRAHMRQSAVLRATYEQVQALRDQPGITWRGKVGQDVLSKEFARAAVMPYMTNFPEIHCITALKAQAHGCVPIVPDAFALKETVQYGLKLAGPLDQPERQREFVDRLIEELRSPTPADKRQEMARWARSKTWASTISRWNEHFSRLLQSKTSPAMSLTN